MRRVSLVALVFCLLWNTPVEADAPRTGLVSGVVLGPEGSPMPGATVQLEGEQGIQTTITDAGGAFRFVFLIPGAYTVRADLSGFGPAAGEISVSAGGRAEVELRLAGAMGEEILVTGEAPLVNKYDVTAGGTLADEELETVPTTERTYMMTLALLPGVVNDAQSLRYGGFQPDVEGTRGARVAYHMDGVDVTFSRLGGGTRMLVPTFAVAEVKLQSSGIDAQYGRSVGGFVSSVLKSGTNRFHGEVAWYGRNMDWDSNYDVTPVLQPDEIVDSWELSFGGPIVRDKLWFFLTYGDQTNPGVAVLGDGVSMVDTGIQQEIAIGKLDWRPTAGHSLSGTYMDFPYQLHGYHPFCADLGSTWLADWPQDFWSVNWNWAASDNTYLEVRVASQETNTNRLLFVDDAGGPDPWKPSGNNYTYNDLAAGLYWNGPVAPNIGEVGFPRDQANVAVSLFVGAHDIKAGVDYQAVEWQSNEVSEPMVLGRGYNPDAPGGFNTPLFYRRFYGVPEGELSVTPTDNWAVFVRDQMTFDRWTFNLGLRFESQQHENDVGDVTVDTNDLSPRLSAVYDVRGDGRLLLSATAARYMYQLPQNWSSNFATIPTGRLYFDEYGFNPTTGAYDIFRRSMLPPAAGEAPQVDAHDKDEFTVGADWVFHSDWALKAKLVYWAQEEMAQIYNQVDAAGNILVVIENNPWAESERTALHLNLQRRLRNNWMIAGSYTWSSTEGNCLETEQGGGGCDPAPGRFIDVLNPDTGEPWSLYNAYGKLTTDRPHLFKLRGLYRLPLGRGHTISFGGNLFVQSGEPWARVENIDILDGAAEMTVFSEPRGSNRNPTHSELSASVEWQFPVFRQLEGGLRLDVINLTDEQELVGTTGLPETGQPAPQTLNYQTPRYVRILARLTF